VRGATDQWTSPARDRVTSCATRDSNHEFGAWSSMLPRAPEMLVRAGKIEGIRFTPRLRLLACFTWGKFGGVVLP
jgi:hypothetical protein